MRKCQWHAQLQAAHCLARGFHLQERSFQRCVTSWADAGFARAAGRSGSGSSCALRSSARSPSLGQHSVANPCCRTRCHIIIAAPPALRAELAAVAPAARGCRCSPSSGPTRRLLAPCCRTCRGCFTGIVFCSACGRSSGLAAAALQCTSSAVCQRASPPAVAAAKGRAQREAPWRLLGKNNAT